ncbi:hypothetical protein [Rhizobium ruizarguesonis]|uniref:hypothetical protein n=1 Tax=Rhizobium ruizarguesonis TaxID=2081791 RepID=UPI00117B0304|nr:hypothetical protein [Rhizobium ruizarguesonis]UED34215.1 hypothetical protein BSO17_24190 [Rhizobium ruizarguesonis]
MMNIAFGHPDAHDLPFDLRHVRRPIFYACPENATAEQKTRRCLSKALNAALKAILSDAAARPSSNHDVPHEPNPRDVELLTRVHNQLPEACGYSYTNIILGSAGLPRISNHGRPTH